MSENTKIEWADHTFNPWEGCQKVGPGCDHCYAETRNARYAGGTAVNWGPGAPRRRTTPANWKKPIAWNAAASTFVLQHGHRPRVFCASLADVFDNAVPTEWRRDLFELIEATPNLDWLLLTKRIGNVRGMVPLPWVSKPFQHGPDPKNIYPAGWPKHVRLGITIVDQPEADRDIWKLLDLSCPNFLSVEPLLSDLDLSPWLDIIQCEDDDTWGRRNIGRLPEMLDWVIVGGESGAGARPMHSDWVFELRDQCTAAGVPFLFKQWGEWTPGVNVKRRRGVVDTSRYFGREWYFNKLDLREDDGHVDNEPDMYRVGKKEAGRLLDGRTWDEVPDHGL